MHHHLPNSPFFLPFLPPYYLWTWMDLEGKYFGYTWYMQQLLPFLPLPVSFISIHPPCPQIKDSLHIHEGSLEMQHRLRNSPFFLPLLCLFCHNFYSNPRWYLSFYFNFVEVVFSTCWLSIIILGDKQGKIGLLSQWMLDGWVEQLIVFFFTNINFISIFHISQKALNL